MERESAVVSWEEEKERGELDLERGERRGPHILT